MHTLKVLAPLFGVLLFASLAFAQSTDSIEGLLAQIKALQAQVATTQISSPSQADDYGTGVSGACPKLTVTMKRGARDSSTGGQVSELQKFLADHYDIDPLELVTGYFGRITQGYVQRFQKEQGLPTFGIAGSMTRATIAKICGGSGMSSTKDTTQTTPVAPTEVIQTVTHTNPLTITAQGTNEQVKCVFNGATTEQKCYTATDSSSPYYGFGCSGVGACVADLKGNNADSVTWKSSCGGYAYTTVDGNNEYANFNCATTVLPATSITVVNPNGGGYWYRGEGVLIEWKTVNIPSDSQMLIRLRVYGSGLTGQTEYNLVTSTNDGYEKLIVPTSVPLGAYTLEIKTTVNNQSYLDASNSYFKVTDVVPTIKSPTCALNVTAGGNTKYGLTGTGYYDGSGSTYVEVYPNDPVIISWTSTNADYSVSPGGDKDSALGVATYNPLASKAYVWTFYGQGGQTSCGVMVEVRPSPLPSPIVELSASPNAVGAVQSSTLSWKTSNASRCVLQYGPTEEVVAVNGSKTVSPSSTTSYRLICTNDPGTGKDGPSAEQTRTVSVATPTCTLTSKPYMVIVGETTVLSWTSQNATYGTWQQDSSANVLGLPLDKLSTSGTQSVTITGGKGTHTPTLLVYNYASSGSCSTTVSVE